MLAFFKLQNEHGVGFHLLRQSWGGRLAAAFATTRPKGLRRLVLAGAVASLELSIKSVNLLRQNLSSDLRDALIDAEHRNDFENTAYNDAMVHFYKKHICHVDPFPRELLTSLKTMAEDKTVYGTM